MTAKEAEQLGYKIIMASPIEVGLTKNGKGIRTWWCHGKIPELDHPKVQEAIEINERTEKGQL